RERALERAIIPLVQVPLPALLLRLGLLLAADRENVVLEIHLDIVLRDARQLRRHVDGVVGFHHIDGRAPAHLLRQHGKPERFVEQPLHALLHLPELRERCAPPYHGHRTSSWSASSLWSSGLRGSQT